MDLVFKTGPSHIHFHKKKVYKKKLHIIWEAVSKVSRLKWSGKGGAVIGNRFSDGFANVTYEPNVRDHPPLTTKQVGNTKWELRNGITKYKIQNVGKTFIGNRFSDRFANMTYEPNVRDHPPLTTHSPRTNSEDQLQREKFSFSSENFLTKGFQKNSTQP